MDKRLQDDIASAYYIYGKNEPIGNRLTTLDRIKNNTLYDIEYVSLMSLSYIYGVWSKTNAAFDGLEQNQINEIIFSDKYKLISLI